MMGDMQGLDTKRVRGDQVALPEIPTVEAKPVLNDQLLSHGKTRRIEFFVVPMVIKGREVEAIYIRNIGDLSAEKQIRIGRSCGFEPATHEENMACAEILNKNPSLLSGAARELFDRYMRNHVRDATSAVKIRNGRVTTPPLPPDFDDPQLNDEQRLEIFNNAPEYDILVNQARGTYQGRGMLFIRGHIPS
jgi:hypothetical protein